ncbi:hypothetical protein NOCARDAX2BIS_530028 [Nocardioides sp. AX2bis]|nr:hypothetical protein NOCARDAX2BIS_530028 [Nocardioides sp. AX2bis]
MGVQLPPRARVSRSRIHLGGSGTFLVRGVLRVVGSAPHAPRLPQESPLGRGFPGFARLARHANPGTRPPSTPTGTSRPASGPADPGPWSLGRRRART